MALQSIRYGGGVWKHQEETRVAMQKQLDERDAQLQDALTEVDRVHAQCVALLRENGEYKASLTTSDAQLKRRDEELLAAKRNVAELMDLLRKANEDKLRLDTERTSTATLWHHAQSQEQHTREALEKLQRHQEEGDREATRLRDLLYDAQEKNEYQAQELLDQKRYLDALAHSNDAKDRQVLTLIRERDAYAQKLAQYRSSNTDCRVGTKTTTVTTISITTAAMETMAPPRYRRLSTGSQAEAAAVEHGRSGNSIRTPGSKQDTSIHQDYDHEKHKLIVMVQQAKARYEKERISNAALQKRVETLEKSHDELVIRFREASKAKATAARQRTGAAAATATQGNTTKVAATAAPAVVLLPPSVVQTHIQAA